MLYSGADLIRISGHQAERAARLKTAALAAPAEVRPAEKSGNTNLDQDTQNALLRFARFVKKAGSKSRKGDIPQGYLTQIRITDKQFESGNGIDVYV